VRELEAKAAAGERALQKLNRLEAEKAVEQAIEQGRLDASQRATVVKLFETDAKTAKAFIESTLVDPERAARNRMLAAATGMDDAQYRAHAARQFGLREEDVL
jgi:hypothetical protein